MICKSMNDNFPGLAISEVGTFKGGRVAINDFFYVILIPVFVFKTKLHEKISCCELFK